MSFHLPAMLEVLAILVVSFLAGFGWTAGSYVFSKIVNR